MVFDVNVLTNQWTIAGVIASFLVAAIALFLGLHSSWKINKLRRLEKREGIIKEIIEWATDILRCCHQYEIPLIGEGSAEIMIRRTEGNRVTKLRELAVKSQYLMTIASRINTKLFDSIKSVLLDVGKLTEALMERVNIETKLDKGNAIQEDADKAIKKYNEQLTNLERTTEALIVLATEAFSDSV